MVTVRQDGPNPRIYLSGKTACSPKKLNLLKWLFGKIFRPYLHICPAKFFLYLVVCPAKFQNLSANEKKKPTNSGDDERSFCARPTWDRRARIARSLRLLKVSFRSNYSSQNVLTVDISNEASKTPNMGYLQYSAGAGHTQSLISKIIESLNYFLNSLLFAAGIERKECCRIWRTWRAKGEEKPALVVFVHPRGVYVNKRTVTIHSYISCNRGKDLATL